MTSQHSGFPVDPDALMRPEAAAAFLGFKLRALEVWRANGRGPAFIRISARAIRYRRSDLLEWAEERLCRSTSDPLAAERHAANEA